jgi:signal transduction histidine kinase
MNRPRHFRIDRVLYLALALGFVPTLVLAGLYYSMASKQMTRDAQQEWQTAAQTMARDTSGQLESIASTVSNFTKLRIFHVALDYERFEGLEDFFNAVVESDSAFLGLAFVDHKQRIVAHSQIDSRYRQTLPAEAWLDQLAKSAYFPDQPGDFGWAQGPADMVAEKYLLYRAPISQDGRVKGHLVGIYGTDLVPNQIRAWLEHGDFAETDLAWSFGLATPTVQVQLASQRSSSQATDAGAQGSEHRSCATAAGRHTLPIEICLQPLANPLFAAARHQQILLFSGLVLAIIIFAAIVLLIVRRSNKIIQMILAKLEEIAAGNYNPLPHAKDWYSNQFVDLTNETVDKISFMNTRLHKAANYQAIARTTQMLAHDVRKPFSLMKLGLGALAQTKNPNDFQALRGTMVDEIDRAMTQVDGMIEDIMEIDRDAPVYRCDTSLNRMLTDVVADCHRLHPQKKIDFHFDLRHRHCLWGDERKLTRVLNNVVCNAFDAVPEQGRISIRSQELADSRGRAIAMIEIANSGSPIPEDVAGRVFDAFNTTKRHGTGLGLVIARKIVEAHGGNIGVRRLPETTFFFTVELSPSKREDHLSQPSSPLGLRATELASRGSRLASDCNNYPTSLLRM